MTKRPNGPLFRDGLISKAGTKQRNSDELPSFASQYIPILPPGSNEPTTCAYPSPWGLIFAEIQHRWRGMPEFHFSEIRHFRPRSLLDSRLVLIAVWFLVLRWGERVVFSRKIRDCSWEQWENWAPDATPHRVALVADPQLVDPHTYPGRPWPLSSLTMRFTDLYIRKSFEHISNDLLPDTVFFLGDLFDGGREWSNEHHAGMEFGQTESSEAQWKGYGQKFWLKEYYRFGRIFFDTWLRSHPEWSRQPYGRRLIVDLPGNHDLGLGEGIRIPARRRFNMFFGDGNRIDILGNHSFVSLDTVSLSAKGQFNPETGITSIDEDAHGKAVWEPVDEFLHNASGLKTRAIDRMLRVRRGLSEFEPQDITVYDIADRDSRPLEFARNETDLPSILLTHVPFYRPPGTPCGPLRERYPPSKKGVDGVTPEKDERNSIPIQAGHQYQNVLTNTLSSEIAELLPDITHIFSGDDHDYCDVTHRQYTTKHGGIREITVKSISWAMGVRHPGFVLLSLWNPVDPFGKALGSSAVDAGTVQTHLCLLPDQLGIFIRYGILLGLSLLSLAVSAYRFPRADVGLKDKITSPVLPLSQTNGYSNSGARTPYRSEAHTNSHSFSSSASDQQSSLAPRPTFNGRLSRSNSPSWAIPVEETSGDPSAWNDIDLQESRRAGKAYLPRRFWVVWSTFRRKMSQVAIVVFAWYIYLLWTS